MSHLLWLQGLEVAAPSSAVTSKSTGQGVPRSPPGEMGEGWMWVMGLRGT